MLFKNGKNKSTHSWFRDIFKNNTNLRTIRYFTCIFYYWSKKSHSKIIRQYEHLKLKCTVTKKIKNNNNYTLPHNNSITMQCSLPWLSQCPVLPVRISRCSWLVLTQMSSSQSSYLWASHHVNHLTNKHSTVLYSRAMCSTFRTRKVQKLGTSRRETSKPVAKSPMKMINLIDQPELAVNWCDSGSTWTDQDVHK